MMSFTITTVTFQMMMITTKFRLAHRSSLATKSSYVVPSLFNPTLKERYFLIYLHVLIAPSLLDELSRSSLPVLFNPFLSLLLTRRSIKKARILNNDERGRNEGDWEGRSDREFGERRRNDLAKEEGTI